MTAPLFERERLTTAARCAKAARAMNEARLSKRAHADSRWSERALLTLGVTLPYPKNQHLSGLHDECAQLLLETRPPEAWPRLVELLDERLTPHHRILTVLASLGEPSSVPRICDWFDRKDSAGAHGVSVHVWDALVAIGRDEVIREAETRLATRPLNRHHRSVYEGVIADVRSGAPRPNRVGFIVSP